MKLIQAVGGLVALFCYACSIVVNYHVVKAVAPEWFTLWAVSGALGTVSMVITMIAKESRS